MTLNSFVDKLIEQKKWTDKVSQSSRQEVYATEAEKRAKNGITIPFDPTSNVSSSQIGDLRRQEYTPTKTNHVFLPDPEGTKFDPSDMTKDAQVRLAADKAIHANKMLALAQKVKEQAKAQQEKQNRLKVTSAGGIWNDEVTLRDLVDAIGYGNGLEYTKNAISLWYKDHPGTTITAGILASVLVSYGLVSLAKKWNEYRKRKKAEKDATIDE